jgi:hypothetical protein
VLKHFGIIGVALGLIALAGCDSQSDQPPRDAPYGAEWKAQQATYEASCVAKGHSAAACQATFPANEYTVEFRQSMRTHSAAITQCLGGSVEACRLIENEDVGHCMTHASEIINPSGALDASLMREICALEFEIAREAGRP